MNVNVKTAQADAAPAVDPVTVEIVRNGLLAVTEEMKTNLMRTAYNLIIYEALDFTVGLFTKEGETVSIGLGLPMFIRGMSETVQREDQALRLRQHPPRRHPRHQRCLHDRQPPESLHLHDAGLPRGRADRVHLLHGALAGRRRHARHGHDRHLLRGDPDPDREVPRRGVVNQELVDIIAMNVRLPETGAGRPARADHRGHDGRAAFPRTGRALRLARRCTARSAVIMDQSEAVARANTLNIPDGVYEAESFMDDDGVDVGEPHADPRADREARRGDDDRPVGRQPAGARVLQLRRHHGHRLRPGRVQMPDDADGLSGQRRQLPAAEGDHADGHGDQRGAAVRRCGSG